MGQLADHPEAANLRLVLSGIVHSNNVGYNRGVTIHSRGVTQVEATKDVVLTATGFDAAGANAQCATSSTIDGISARSRMIERIAWKRAMRSKGAAEQIASHHAEQRVAAQMDDRADKLLAQARDQYHEHFRNPLLRRGEFPQEMDLRHALRSPHTHHAPGQRLPIGGPHATPSGRDPPGLGGPSPRITGQ